MRLAYKPFPWPAVTVDLAAVAAAAAFNLLLVYAFLAPTRNVVATMVREKELRLREGMRILGLQVCLPAAMCCCCCSMKAGEIPAVALAEPADGCLAPAEELGLHAALLVMFMLQPCHVNQHI